MENIVVQYYLQTRAQHAYRLQRYDGAVALFEPDSHRGLLAALLKPYVNRLRVRYLALGDAAPRAQALAEAFSPRLRAHFLCMRDESFVTQLARELEELLD